MVDIIFYYNYNITSYNYNITCTTDYRFIFYNIMKIIIIIISQVICIPRILRIQY